SDLSFDSDLKHGICAQHAASEPAFSRHSHHPIIGQPLVGYYSALVLSRIPPPDPHPAPSVPSPSRLHLAASPTAAVPGPQVQNAAPAAPATHPWPLPAALDRMSAALQLTSPHRQDVTASIPALAPSPAQPPSASSLLLGMVSALIDANQVDISQSIMLL